MRPAITEVPFDIRVPYNTDKRWGVPITVLQQKNGKHNKAKGANV